MQDFLAGGRGSPSAPSPPITSFDLTKEDEQVHSAAQADAGVTEQISAADYDPNLDRHEDEEKRVRGVVLKDEAHHGGDVVQGDVEEEVEEEEEEEDDVDDMFALITSDKPKTKKVKKKVTVRFPLCPSK